MLSRLRVGSCAATSGAASGENAHNGSTEVLCGSNIALYAIADRSFDINGSRTNLYCFGRVFAVWRCAGTES